MGDAEFAGGGSVKWEVTNSDGESGGGNRTKCKGKDKDPNFDFRKNLIGSNRRIERFSEHLPMRCFDKRSG